MPTFTLTPRVDETQEFIEIANDFSNPLDVVREAISNGFDAGASEMEILFDVVQEYNETLLRITLRDNGHGMDREGLQAFFDLGNSTRRGDEGTVAHLLCNIHAAQPLEGEALEGAKRFLARWPDGPQIREAL